MSLRLAMLAVLVFVLGIAPMAPASPASRPAGTLTADPVQADGLALAQAMDVPASDILEADTMGSDVRAAAVSERLGTSFPTRGSSFAILSTGVATDAALPNTEGDHSTVLDGLNNVQGNDLTRLHLQLQVPADADCANFDVGFYSEEFGDPVDIGRLLGSGNPELIGQFNDTFTAQLNDSTLTINPDGESVGAPGNFAVQSGGLPIAVNTSTHDPSTGTTYDEATPVMRASTPVVGGEVIDLYLSIQDLGDSTYDSAAFLDNFFWSSGVECPAGAQPDSDGDGLPDSWEEHGLTVNGQFLDLPAMGADPNHKDVFVEVDHMDETNEQPLPAAFALVEKAFAEAPVENPDGTIGINLHVDYGTDAPISSGSATTFGAMSQADTLPLQSQLGTSVGATKTTIGDYDWSGFDAIKAQHFDPVRAGVFHYAVFAHAFGGNYFGMGGIARAIPGSDIVLALGFSSSSGVSMADVQAGTFMHELGHNLGLGHGGGDGVNYKPNYLSVMNYLFQFGVPVSPTGVKFDYSRSNLPALDETNLSESDGIGTTDPTMYVCPNGTFKTIANGSSIDWNCDGDATDTDLSADINEDGENTTLNGYDDWANLIFTGGSIGAAGAQIPLPEATDSAEITPDQIAKILSASDKTPPTLTVPANLVVNATKPNGAAVSFSATATDNIDPSPAVVCVPASGSTFAIGTTSVSCSATDLAGNKSKAGFTVKVKSAPEQIVDLVNKLRADLKLTSLADPLAAALQTVSTTLIQKKPQLACAALNVFIAGVKLTPTKYLTDAQKTDLVADATRIRAVISC